MISRSLRRVLTACVLSAVAAAALAAPGAANAEFKIEQCAGESIHGKGSSLQKLLETTVWNPDFSSSTNALACNGAQGSGGTPKVTYTSTGSGAGLESWGIETKAGGEINFGHETGYVGTDGAPNAKQKEEVESHGSPGTLLTIPVAQAALTVSVHLPKGCEKVSGGPVPGRLAMSDATVQNIFVGKDVKWSQVLNKAKLEGNTECTKLGKNAAITRAVREDGSGTTATFMKFLWVINKKEVLPGLTWKQEGEKADNVTWPKEAEHPLVRGNGNGGVAKAIEATPGSIGYVNLADARNAGGFTPPTGGEGKATFWSEVENGTVKEEGKTVHTYSDPATNGDVAAKANSNCEETLYTNGTKKFPPPTTEQLWNEVTTSKKQKNYDICGLTYNLSLTKYSAYTKGTLEATNEKEARTAFDYAGWLLSSAAGGGQKVAEGVDYLGLPTSEVASQNVLLIAQQGQKKIGF